MIFYINKITDKRIDSRHADVKEGIKHVHFGFDIILFLYKLNNNLPLYILIFNF